MVEPDMSSLNPTREEFAALLDESLNVGDSLEGSVIKGTVVSIEADLAIIDVGLKTEGRVPLKEFHSPGQENALVVGDEVEVLSRAHRERHGRSGAEPRQGAARGELDTARKVLRGRRTGRRHDLRPGQGRIYRRSRRRGGVPARQPGRHPADPRRHPLFNIPQPFQILKMDKRRGNIVVSRRAVLEETRAEQRTELVQNLSEGQVVEGVVKNITDYGAFVDLGGIDGLLHVTDIAWRRVNHPTDVLTIGQTLNVQIIKINPETQRISLGMKQLEADPWDGVEAKYPEAA